jgi:predicted RNase H-like nuclease (RuvC/YqgF family)
MEYGPEGLGVDMTETAAINQLHSTVSELSKTVSELSANVQTQTATFEGFQKLFELHIKTIQSDTLTLRDALRVQDADFDRFRREVIEPLRTQVGELRHGIKGVQSYPKTLVTVVSRVQQLERENIARNSKAQGFRLAAHAIWGVLTGIGTFLGLLLGSHHQ